MEGGSGWATWALSLSAKVRVMRGKEGPWKRNAYKYNERRQEEKDSAKSGWQVLVPWR